MKKNKLIFYLDNYLFEIVRMNVFNSDKSINMDYFLLIDQDCFIHDYKIQFNQISIKTKTTASHKFTKKDDLAFIRRVEIINKLGLQHFFGSGTKEISYITNLKKINKLNQWVWNQNWIDITFQNMEYILNGYNAKGQGDGRGTFQTEVNKDAYPFGFLFQCLNVSKIIKRIYSNIDYSKKWIEFEQAQKYISFEEFVNKNKSIEKYLRKFKIMSHDYGWKELKKEFKNELNKKSNQFVIVENEVGKKRNEFKKNIENQYLSVLDNKQKLTQFLYKTYFNISENDCDSKYEKAHIKPVWLIKNEYIMSENKNLKILEQISDPNNFLPLPKTTHDLYDDNYFYWDIKGELVKIKNPKEHEINKFMKINDNKLNDAVRWYLNEYLEKVVNKYKKQIYKQ